MDAETTEVKEETTTEPEPEKRVIPKGDAKALAAMLPDSDRPGEVSKFTGPAPEEAAEIYEGLLAGGRESLLDLIAMLRDHEDPEFEDFRAEYFLHGLAIHVGQPGKEEQREMFAKALASRLGRKNLPVTVKAFLIRELQVAGGKEVVGALRRALADEDLCEYAAQALVAIGDGAAKALRGALEKAQGKCRATIVQNLGVVRDKGSVRALQEALKDEDCDVRTGAVWALARIADPKSVGPVLKAADVDGGYERVKATQACLVLAENLLASGKKKDAAKIYKHLRDSRTDPNEKYVREVAEKALAEAG